jgi:ribosome-associated toxin RatA of RatAB toxin-antitoxin module
MMRWIMLVLIATIPALPARADIPVQVIQAGGATFVTGEIRAPVNRQQAWEVLTDYGRYAEIVPGMRVSRLVGESNGIKMVEQAGEMRSGYLRLAYNGMLQIQENYPDDVRIRFATGTFRNTMGEWQIKPVGKKEVTISYKLRLDPASPYPPQMLSSVAPAQVQSWVDSFAAELTRIGKQD